MKTVILQNLRRRKRRVLGASIAVIIGIAFLVATMTFGDSVSRGVDSVFSEAFSGVDAEVRSSSSMTGFDGTEQYSPIDSSLVDELAALDNVQEAVPIISGTAMIVADGSPIGGGGPPTLGGNWADYDLNPFTLIDGRAPSGPTEVVIDRQTADSADIAVGDAIEVAVVDQMPVTVVGIAQLESNAPMGGTTYTWFDTDTAQELFLGADDKVTAIDLVAVDRGSDRQLADEVASVVGDGFDVLTQQELIDEQVEALGSDFLDFFKVFLNAFAGIALLVATFSISNTFAIMVAQRSQESAMLRAIGASRRQILTSITGEAAAIGLFASVIGLFVGVGLAIGLSEMMSAAGFGVPTSGIGLSWSTAGIALGIGIGVTVLASVLPAIRAARIAPLAALRDVADDRSGRSVVRMIVGALLAAAGVATMVVAPTLEGSAMAIAGLGGMLTFVGIVVLGPVLARLTVGIIGLPIKAIKGQTGLLARRNAMRNPKRTASTASALMIGVAIVALFASFATSIKQTMTDLVDEAFGGDLVIYSEDYGGPGMDPQLALDVGDLDGVMMSTGLAGASMTLDGEEDFPFAGNFSEIAQVVSLGDIQGEFADAPPSSVAVSEDFAKAGDDPIEIGDTMEAGFLDGTTETVTVTAIYETEELFGSVLVSRDVWDRHTVDPLDMIVLVGLEDGASIDTIRPEVTSIVDSYGTFVVEDSDQFIETQNAQVDQILGLVYGLLGLAVLIAVIGVSNTISLSLYERTRELGLLRALGQTRGELRSTVRWESVMITVFGTTAGIALGTFICWGLVGALDAQTGIGTFAPSYGTLGIILVVALVAGLLAAARPAARAAKLDVLQAIATT